MFPYSLSQIFVILNTAWHLMHMSGMLGVGLICACLLELQHTTQKWLHLLHILQNARHHLNISAVTQYLQSSILTLFSALWFVACPLSSYSFIYSQHLLCFSFHLAPLSAPSATLLLEPTLVPVHCLLVMFFCGRAISPFYDFLYYFIVYTINKLFLGPSIMFLVTTPCCFNT